MDYLYPGDDTSDGLNLEAWWPELFEGMDALDRRAIVQACAASWHEGWQPDYDDVKDLCELSQCLIDEAEYDARQWMRADRLRAVLV